MEGDVRSEARIRIGEVEVTVAGTEQFVRAEVSRVIEAAIGLHVSLGRATGAADLVPSPGAEVRPRPGSRKAAKPSPPTTKRRSADEARKAAAAEDVAAMMARVAKTGQFSLTLAALARLAVKDGQQPLSRADLHNLMTKVTGFYRPSYRSNMSGTMRRLVAEGYIEKRSPGVYVLAKGAAGRLKAMFDAGPTAPSAPVEPSTPGARSALALRRPVRKPAREKANL